MAGLTKVFDRRMARFMREPPTVRNASSVIVASTASIVVASGVVMWIVDREEYPNIWRGMWWALQTVTTVGYGDVTPAHTSGRIVGVFVMLQGIAFLTIIIAALTSTFVGRAQEMRRDDDASQKVVDQADLDARLDDLSARLERIEQLLTQPGRG